MSHSEGTRPDGDTEQRRRETEILAALARAIGTTLDVDLVLQQAVEAAWQLSGSDIAHIALRDPDTDTMRIRYGAGPVLSRVHEDFRIERGKGSGGLAWDRAYPVRTDDRLEDPRLSRDYDHVIRAEQIVTTLVVPILIQNEVEGLLWVHNRSRRSFTDDDEVVLERLATFGALAIRNAQLYDEAQRRRRQAETLVVLAREIGAKLDLDAVLQEAVEAARKLLGSDFARIALRDPAANVMVLRYGAPLTLGRALQGLRVEKGKGLGGLAWALGRPVRTANQLEDPRLTRDYDTVVRAEGIVAVLAVPIVIGGEVEGLLYVDNRSPRPFTDHDEALLGNLELHVALAIQNARQYQRAQSASERLAVLSRRLIEVQEAERRHLARELHDDFGQVLTVLGLDLARLREAVGSPHSERLDETLRIVNRLIEQVRNRSLDLHPSVLDDLGLVPALEWYVERQAQSGGFAATVVAEPPELRWPAALESVCFRVAQEALTNVVRHALARHVRIELRQTPAGLQLGIRDDGVGFDVEAARRDAMHGRSLGLLGMQERAQLAGGRLRIDSAPGAGTLVEAAFPVAPT